MVVTYLAHWLINVLGYTPTIIILLIWKCNLITNEDLLAAKRMWYFFLVCCDILFPGAHSSIKFIVSKRLDIAIAYVVYFVS